MKWLGFAVLVVMAVWLVKAPDGESVPMFEDVTASSGIDFVHRHGGSGRRYLPETMGAGGAVLDFDGDGWMDLYLVQSAPLPGYKGKIAGNQLFRNLGDGRFKDATPGSGAGDAGYGQGAVAADYDSDGDTDIYVTNFGANVLLRNDGMGRFTDVSQDAGVAGSEWSSSAAFFDAEGDGDLDLYVVNYLEMSPETQRDCRDRARDISMYCHPDVYPAAQDRFYLNDGNGRFVDATDRAGFVQSNGKGMGVISGDFNRDGIVDLYVTNDSTPNFLFLGLGAGRFEEAGLLWGAAYNAKGRSEAGMGVDAGDVNGDGWTDLIVTNLSLETNALYLGSADGFTHSTRAAGLFLGSLPVLGFGVELADFDNDGDLDLFVANGDVNDQIDRINDLVRWAQADQLFLNDGRGNFEEVPGDRLGAPAQPRVSRAALRIDYDNDGRLDLLVTHSNERARLYRNRIDAGDWIGFLPVQDGRMAVGSQLLVGEDQMIADEMLLGSGYQSSSDPRLHLGLGGASSLPPLRLRMGGQDGSRFVACRSGSYYRVDLSEPAGHGAGCPD